MIMKIEKINDNQIKIILSSKDLSDRNLNINELAYSNEKMQSLFREMLEKALVEHSFKPEANVPLMIEAALLSSDSIMIIVTKVAQFEDGSEIIDLVPKAKTERQFRGRGIIEPGAPPAKNDGLYIYSFAAIDDVASLASRLNVRVDSPSKLYKAMDRYFLVIRNGEQQPGAAMDSLLAEYGQRHLGTELSFSYLTEHAELLIAENAIGKLSAL